jgi:propanol-preferring alcohol dehydrogenase
LSDPNRRTIGFGNEPSPAEKAGVLNLAYDTATYRAVQAVAPGQLELTTMPLREPPPGYVRIRVQACGVCHSDARTVAGMFPISWPRVPGHEVIGRIDAVGAGVQGWTVGQRVGVGFLADSCGYCSACRAGDLVHCENQEYSGVQHDGGYAEVMIAKASGLVIVPDELDSEAAAPLPRSRTNLDRISPLLGFPKKQLV